MFLYTPEVMALLGDISAMQMVSFLSAALALTNEAMTNSDIGVEFSLVFAGLVSNLRRSPGIDC